MGEILYYGSLYKTDVEGEDEKGAGGLWDLAGDFADRICLEFNGAEAPLPQEDLDRVYSLIQEELYGLIKYGILSMDNERHNGNEM